MDDRATAHDYPDPMSEQLLGPAADVLRSFGSAFGGRWMIDVLKRWLGPEWPNRVARLDSNLTSTVIGMTGYVAALRLA